MNKNLTATLIGVAMAVIGFFIGKQTSVATKSGIVLTDTTIYIRFPKFDTSVHPLSSIYTARIGPISYDDANLLRTEYQSSTNKIITDSFVKNIGRYGQQHGPIITPFPFKQTDSAITDFNSLSTYFSTITRSMATMGLSQTEISSVYTAFTLGQYKNTNTYTTSSLETMKKQYNGKIMMYISTYYRKDGEVGYRALLEPYDIMSLCPPDCP